MRVGHAKHGRPARKRTSAGRQGARGLCPRAFSAKRSTDSAEKRSFSAGLKEEDPRLRLRGSIPSRRPHLPGEIFGTWLCGPAGPDSI